MPENMSDNMPLMSAGYEMGRYDFKSFLLAGERYVTADLSRKGTDEEKFGDFFQGLDATNKNLMTSYFKRQANLTPMHRALVLGNLVKIDAAETLTLTNSFRDVLRPSIRADLDLVLDFSDQIIVDPPREPASNRLVLVLEDIKVVDSQDAYRIPLLGEKNTTDEVHLGIISVDESGEVRHRDVDLGEIKQKKSKDFRKENPYNGKALAIFDITEGRSKDLKKDSFPKVYSTTVVAVEKDDGGFNKLLGKAAEYAKKKITEALIASGIVAAGAVFGVTIPVPLALLAANYVKGFVDSFIDWLADLFNNGDDVLGQNVRRATLYGYTSKWSSSNKARSDSWKWRFRGSDGIWDTNMAWLLVKSNVAEI